MRPIRRYTVTRRDDTQQGTFWRKVGTIAEWPDGNMTLNLFMYPQTFTISRDDKYDPDKHGKRLRRRQEG